MENTFKDWNIIRCIGAGSFGKVYEIHREDFGHTYKAALKVIRIPQSQIEIDSAINEGMTEENVTDYFYGVVEKIVEEFALMSKLKGNSNIVSYEDHHVEKNKDDIGWTIYIRMELLTPLYQHIKQNKITVKDVIQLGIDVCHALEICQKYNIIHRDIKPENIFVSDLGTFKLGDFGIARELEKTSSALSKVGTKVYMAPEVYKGLEYNSTVDVYSLGMVLYRFLNNNRLPFMPAAPQPIKYSDKEKADIKRMSGEVMPKPCNADGRLAEIVLKACDYNPRNRYESARDMRKALEAIMYSEQEKEVAYPNGDELENSRAEYVMGTGQIDKYIVSNLSDKNLNVNEGEEKEEGTRYLFEQNASKENKSNKEEKIIIKADNCSVKNELKNDVISLNNTVNASVPFEEKKVKKIPAQSNLEKNSRIISRKKLLVVFGSICVASVSIILSLLYTKSIRIDKDEKCLAEVTTTVEITNGAPTETETLATTEMISYTLHDVSGKAKEEAVNILTEQTGLEINVEEKYSDTVEKGQVISQNPKSDEVFYVTDDTQNYNVLSNITITVSKGSKKIKIPNLKGKTLEKAKKLLQQKGLKVKVASSVYSNEIASGSVVSQSIDAGTKVKKGKVVTVTPSMGKKPYTTQRTVSYSTQASQTSTQKKSTKIKQSKDDASLKQYKDDASLGN